MFYSKYYSTRMFNKNKHHKFGILLNCCCDTLTYYFGGFMIVDRRKETLPGTNDKPGSCIAAG